MYCAISTKEGKHVAEEADKEGDTIGGPCTAIDEAREDALRSIVWPQNNQGYQDGKEPNNMQDEGEAFKLWQSRTDDGIDENGDQDHCPEQQRAMPVLVLICVWVAKNDQALDHGARKIRSAGHFSLPAKEGEPARHVTKESLAARGRKHCHPVVLSARDWGPVVVSTVSITIRLDSNTNIEASSARAANTESVPIQTRM